MGYGFQILKIIRKQFSCYLILLIFLKMYGKIGWIKKNFTTLAYCDFESDTLKYAKFQDLRNIYDKEKSLLAKQAYKLNNKSLYPSSTERQKVHLADNVFHHSTISSLKNMPNAQDTADFLEIIRQWWDIVNNRSFLKGRLKRNDWCKLFESQLDLRINFLHKFVIWLDKWQNIEIVVTRKFW